MNEQNVMDNTDQHSDILFLNIWATSWENLLSVVCDQEKHKPVCSSTEAS